MSDWDGERPDILGRKVDSNIPPVYDGWHPSQFKWVFLIIVVPAFIALVIVWWTHRP